VLTNADSKLASEQRRQAEIDAKNDGIIQDAVDRAAKEGPKPELTAHGSDYLTTYDRLAEQEAYAAGDRKSLIPLTVMYGPQYPAGFHWVLSDADMAMVEAGYACGYCLKIWGGVWRPACDCCGFDRELL
jgi:hypothetical protein